MALVYKNYCTGCTNLFVGGVNDWSHVSVNSEKKKWQLAILRLKEDGTSDGDVFHINQAFPGDHDTEADPPIIDHMYLDSTSQPG